jgi:hypothetical protein
MMVIMMVIGGVRGIITVTVMMMVVVMVEWRGIWDDREGTTMLTPGEFEHFVEAWRSIQGILLQTGEQKTLVLIGHVGFQLQVELNNLLFRLEWQLTIHHVVQ